ncbi:MAG: type I methionyl aminopeptidase [bacterium]
MAMTNVPDIEVTPVTVDQMKEPNAIVAGVLRLLKERLEPGIDTLELDRLAEEYIRDHGARPAFKGYQGYPNTITASVNDQIVHGIPDEDQIIESGDIVSLDVGAFKRNCYGDSALTVIAGESTSASSEKLLDVTYDALCKGIERVQVGNRLGEVGQAIQDHVQPHGFGIVRDWAGHFIGHEMHLEPRVPNYGPADRGPTLQEGMFLAIEPMINLGTYETRVLEDDWTVVTTDGSLSAHFEHTVAVTEDGPRVLSRREDEVF